MSAAGQQNGVRRYGRYWPGAGRRHHRGCAASWHSQTDRRTMAWRRASPCFAGLRRCAQPPDWPDTLSMGMSRRPRAGDRREGASIVRVGTAIFGERARTAPTSTYGLMRAAAPGPAFIAGTSSAGQHGHRPHRLACSARFAVAGASRSSNSANGAAYARIFGVRLRSFGDAALATCWFSRVKPQQMKTALAPIARHSANRLVLSIAAGCAGPPQALAGPGASHARLVRHAQHPALIGAGVTRLYADPRWTPPATSRQAASWARSAASYWAVHQKRQMDAVTDLGDGPACVFHFIRCSIRAQPLRLGEPARPPAIDTVLDAAAGGGLGRRPRRAAPGHLQGGTTGLRSPAWRQPAGTTNSSPPVQAAEARGRELGAELGKDAEPVTRQHPAAGDRRRRPAFSLCCSRSLFMQWQRVSLPQPARPVRGQHHRLDRVRPPVHPRAVRTGRWRACCPPLVPGTA